MDNDRKLKVLIVEDEPVILRLLALSFTRAGFETHTAGDGVEGLALARSMKPDAVVFDILMPKMDGITMLRRIRNQRTWGRNIKAFAYTNPNRSETIQEAFDIGIDEFLIKASVGISDLIRRVETHAKV